MAFFHAVMDELVSVHPPLDMVPPGWCWKLRKSMYGTRRAGRLWADYVKRVMEDDGSETIGVFSMVFLNRSKRYIVAVWSDDFAFTVASEMLPHLTELLERNIECRLIGNIGPGMLLKVVKLLNRQLAWTEQGFEWHADTKHSRSVLLKHGLVEGKSTSEVIPAARRQVRTSVMVMISSVSMRRRSTPAPRGPCSTTLGPSGLAVHGGSVSVGNHEATAETPSHDEALLEVHGRETVLRLEVRLPRVARRECDLDWASDSERRRSVDCVHIYHGGRRILNKRE